ncbi:MAG: hypothetical protein QOG98_1120 [Pseudonocardiales bacterium]|jgi:hypothetical protein|nr:hypothetical protein [Pseudonocardiales bacterium]
MCDAGLIPPGLLAAASHEADLVEHPYIGYEHLELARLRAEDRDSDYNALKGMLPIGLRRRWWRPRGRRSALRSQGLLATRNARREAESND